MYKRILATCELCPAELKQQTNGADYEGDPYWEEGDFECSHFALEHADQEPEPEEILYPEEVRASHFRRLLASNKINPNFVKGVI